MFKRKPTLAEINKERTQQNNELMLSIHQDKDEKVVSIYHESSQSIIKDMDIKEKEVLDENTEKFLNWFKSLDLESNALSNTYIISYRYKDRSNNDYIRILIKNKDIYIEKKQHENSFQFMGKTINLDFPILIDIIKEKGEKIKLIKHYYVDYSSKEIEDKILFIIDRIHDYKQITICEPYSYSDRKMTLNTSKDTIEIKYDSINEVSYKDINFSLIFEKARERKKILLSNFIMDI